MNNRNIASNNIETQGKRVGGHIRPSQFAYAKNSSSTHWLSSLIIFSHTPLEQVKFIAVPGQQNMARRSFASSKSKVGLMTNFSSHLRVRLIAKGIGSVPSGAGQISLTHEASSRVHVRFYTLL